MLCVVCAMQNILFFLSVSRPFQLAELLQAVSDWCYGYSVVFKFCILQVLVTSFHSIHNAIYVNALMLACLLELSDGRTDGRTVMPQDDGGFSWKSVRNYSEVLFLVCFRFGVFSDIMIH